MTPSRDEFLGAVKMASAVGIQYRWGGKEAHAMDCSGLVTFCLWLVGGPDIRQMMNAENLFMHLSPAVEPQAGDLAFYGSKNSASHVVVCLGGPLDPIIGANGGDRQVVTSSIALQRGAFVKQKKSPTYRPDLLGYRSTSMWWK